MNRSPSIDQEVGLHQRCCELWNRPFRGFAAALILLVGTGFSATGCSSAAVGADRYGLHLFLSRDGQPVGKESQDTVDRMAARLTRSLQGEDGDESPEARPGLSSELPQIAAEALSRAREKSKMYNESRPDIVAALAAYRVEEIQFRWGDGTIDPDDVGHGHGMLRAHSSHFDDLRLPSLEDGKSLFAEVEARVSPWPRKEGYAPGPDVILAQAAVTWYSRRPGASLLVEALVQLVAERVGVSGMKKWQEMEEVR